MRLHITDHVHSYHISIPETQANWVILQWFYAFCFLFVCFCSLSWYPVTLDPKTIFLILCFNFPFLTFYSAFKITFLTWYISPTVKGLFMFLVCLIALHCCLWLVVTVVVMTVSYFVAQTALLPMLPTLTCCLVAHVDLEPQQSFHFSFLGRADYRQAPS